MVLFTVRFLLAGLLLLAWSWFIQKERLPRGHEWKEVGIFGAFNTTIYLGVFIIALEDVTAGVTSIALAINPLLMGVMTALSRRIRVPAIQWISIAIGIVGVVIVSYPLLMNGHATLRGMVLMALCMVAYSFSSVYYASVKWELSRTAINGWQVFLGGVMLLPFAILFPQKANHYDFRFWASEFWLVVPVSIGAVQLWLYLLKIDTVRASLWLFLCPIFGLGFAAVLLAEPLSMYTAVGTLLVLVALFIGQRQPAKASS